MQKQIGKQLVALIGTEHVYVDGECGDLTIDWDNATVSTSRLDKRS